MTPEPERHEGDLGHGGTLPTVAALTDAVRPVLEAAWRPDAAGGFCVPNPTTYPWQWLWDSCFHAVVWAHLGDERALQELRSALSTQGRRRFVPHLRYGDGPFPMPRSGGGADASTITQPPMYGHAVAELTRLGLPPDDELVRRRSRAWSSSCTGDTGARGGLVELCHPWESGCDDSPRWDGTVPGGRTPEAWYALKGDLVASIERSPSGTPIHNPGVRHRVRRVQRARGVERPRAGQR